MCGQIGKRLLLEQVQMRCHQPCFADGLCSIPAEPMHVCADDTAPVAASWSAKCLSSSMARLRRRGGPDWLLGQRPCPRASKASSVPGHPCPVSRSYPCGTPPEKEDLASGERPLCRGQAACMLAQCPHIGAAVGSTPGQAGVPSQLVRPCPSRLWTLPIARQRGGSWRMPGVYVVHVGVTA